MSVNINTSTNTVTINNSDRVITVNDNNQSTSVNVTQPVTNVITVATVGPQGPAGSQGSGSIDTGSFATTGSNIFIGNQTINGTVSATSFTGSLQGTASIANTVLTSSVSYISSSNNSISLNEIEVADYSNDVTVSFINGRLKFIFGTPESQSISSFSYNSTFDTDRFNQVLDSYTASAIWSNGGYTLISASIYEGTSLLSITGSGTSLSYATTTSGSHTYTLYVTASNPLDNSILVKSSSLSGTLSKTNPGNPTLSLTPIVQLNAASNQIEQGVTGSILFTSASGASNNWVFNFLNSSVDSIYFVTASATGSATITISATAYYSSSGVGGSDNNPPLTTTTSTSTSYTKIRSVRYGVSSDTSYTQAQLENVALWDTTIGGTIGRIAKGTVNPHLYQFTVTTSAQYIYIVIDSSYTLTGILNVNNSYSNDLGVFTATTIGNYKVYRSNNISATTILYELRTS